MTMLNLAQQRPLIRSELSRRIGYTNGLHDISRFARVVKYLHGIAPASILSLRSAIIEKEAVRGKKYADGVIDVGRALGLLHKAGNTLTLSDKGFALHAIQRMNDNDESTRALLLHSVLESDGEATLNLLDILSKGGAAAPLGELLVERLLTILSLRETWANQQIESKFIRDMVLQELADSRHRLAAAVNIDRKETQSWSAYKEERSLTPEQKVERFYSHTVNPRRGWLKDFGCVQQQGRGEYHVTEIGHRLLSSFKEASCYSNSAFILPFSVEVSQLLRLPTSSNSTDLCWQAIAASFVHPPSPAQLSPDDHIDFIMNIYPHVRFHVFNEAAIDSIYHALAAQLATKGQYLNYRSHNALLDFTSSKFPDKVYRLRQRYGRTGYIALRGHVA